jgi:hypothetical protein
MSNAARGRTGCTITVSTSDLNHIAEEPRALEREWFALIAAALLSSAGEPQAV